MVGVGGCVGFLEKERDLVGWRWAFCEERGGSQKKLSDKEAGSKESDEMRDKGNKEKVDG